MLALAEKLREALADRPNQRVFYLRWCESWRRYATFFQSLGNRTGGLRVLVYAYSWGAGWGCMKLARCLRKLGITIEYAVLSDPVFRHPCIFCRWQAFLPFRRIRLPDNLRVVTWYRQRQSAPMGHNLVSRQWKRKGCIHRATIIHGPYTLAYDHTEMDDAPKFHERAIDIALRYT
jgi:hypothetical protein